MTIPLRCGAEFLHIPKTGGEWVTSVLQDNGLSMNRRGHKHADFDRNLLHHGELSGRQHLVGAAIKFSSRLVPGLTKVLTTGRESTRTEATFRFCFVRHPLTWYESWWKYMQGRGWNDWGTKGSGSDWHPNSTLNGLGSADFNEFVRNVVRARPGYVSELFFSYTKPEIDFIGKTENLRNDLAAVLDLLELDYDKNTLLQSPRKNASKTSQSEITWDPELRKLVTQLELPALTHFGYLSEQEKIDFGINFDIETHAALNVRAA